MLSGIALAGYDRWTLEEDQFLRRNWKTMHRRDIAAQLGRSKGAIVSRAKHLELEICDSPCLEEVRLKTSIMRDYFKEGYAFEVYVANTLFPRPDYDIEYFTTRRDDLAGRYIASTLNPDMQIRQRKSNHLFWVECKWRTRKSMRNGKLAVLSRVQLDRYCRFQEKEGKRRIYIVIGLDGRPNAPSRLFCLPIHEFNNQPWPPIGNLARFERSPTEPFQYWYGRLR